MTIQESIRGEVVIVCPDGRLTVETEQQLKQAVARLLAAGHVRLVLNLADVPYIDSCGLGAMVHAYTSARRLGGDLKLLNVSSRIQHLLGLTRLNTVFETCASEAEAERRLTVPLYGPHAWIPEVTKGTRPAGPCL